MHSYVVLQARAERIFNILEQLQNILLEYLVASEGSKSITTETLSIMAEKVVANRIGEKENKLKKCRFKPPFGAAFGLEESKLRHSVKHSFFCR